MTTPVSVVKAKSASRFKPRTWRTACAPITPPSITMSMMKGCAKAKFRSGGNESPSPTPPTAKSVAAKKSA
jgi:hypothetical protein